MADNSILWQGSRIVDGFVRPRRPWAFLAGVFALVLFADVVLEAALQEQRSALDLEVNNGEDLRHQLQRTVDDPAQPWLLVGDSVLAGDVLAGKAKEWRNRRIVDYMRQEKSDRYPDMFYQVALNGLLPTDIRAIVTKLDRLDPQGRVRLVVQLNPRYFSKYYSGLRDTTRAWLGRDTQAVAAWGEVNWVKWAVQEVRNGGLWLKEHAPVYRHAAWLHWPPGDFPVRLTPKGQTEARAGGALLGAVRIREHYTGLNLSVASRQVQALMDIHRRLEARGRQGLFFLTPLNDSFLDELSGPDAYGRTVAQIRAIFGNDTGLVRFVNLDHPLFTPEMFLDHCHLWPDGNRLLAMNLLHEMNIAVHQMPDVQQTAYTEDPEQALVWNTARGYADGAGWQALFKRPRGLVVAGPNRLLIADTENHCLREVIGARPIVRTLAGLPGASGYKDGKAEEALLSAPAYPCLLNGALYFIDRQGALLRRYEDGLVFTEYVAQGPAWRALNMLRAHDGCLYALDQKSTILRYAPQTHETRVVYASRPEVSVRAFDISPDGRLFVVDNRNRVALYRLGAEQDTGPVTSPQIIFPNEATELIAADDYFPLPFDRVQLREVLDIRYIRRYDGLLVQDYLAPKKLYEEEVSRGEAWSFSEGVQLRFLRLADNMVYPWRYPSARESEMLYNAATESHISPFRIGSLVVDPDTAATYYLERDRSYLFRMEDGLWGAAKYSNDTPVRYGLNLLATTGEFVRLTVHPEQFLTQRDAVLPKRGPFLALFLGSSMTGMSDLTGQLSLLHLASSELERNLGYCEGALLETLVRNQAGAKVDDSVRAFEDFVAGGGRADVLLLEFVNPGAEEEQFLDYLERLTRAASVYDTRVILMNSYGMLAHYREALYPITQYQRQLADLIRGAGFILIEPSAELLQRSHALFPLGSPPYQQHHSSPWALGEAAHIIAQSMYPKVAGHLRDRVPALLRPEAAVEAPSAGARLLAIFAGADPQGLGLMEVDRGALLVRREGGTLQVAADVARLGVKDPAKLSPADLDRLALSVLYAVLSRDPGGRIATAATISLASFANYDEYGQGVLESAQIHWQKTLDRAGLQELLAAVATARR